VDLFPELRLVFDESAKQEEQRGQHFCIARVDQVGDVWDETGFNHEFQVLSSFVELIYKVAEDFTGKDLVTGRPLGENLKESWEKPINQQTIVHYRVD
jgi:dTDP-4-dehydrorhamnose 3,5-epimerase-like enzyme